MDLTSQTESLAWLFGAVKLLVNVIFAGAVARDAGSIIKERGSTQLVSGLTWAFATLVVGIWVAVAYWVLHRARLPRLET